jgi:hypothetical protein
VYIEPKQAALMEEARAKESVAILVKVHGKALSGEKMS